ncbi:MAG TPA: CPBP family intramembrane glutamic endopeptidase [Candidatus Dormibacteraeota bacterium]
MRSWVGDHPLGFAVIGVLLAIATTTVLDAVGFGINVLLLPLVFFGCWYLQRLTRIEIGLVLGAWQPYVLAVAYPVLVLTLIGVIARATGAANMPAVNWTAALLNLAGMVVVTAVFALVTEEGIFRGWLWAALFRAGFRRNAVLVWTSVAFGLWHLSTALLPTPFHPALVQVPVYIASAIAIGLVWAQLRLVSGSIAVTSVSHGLWNGLVYVLFGYGTTAGVFEIHNTLVFGPEIGLLGLGANVVAAALLWLAVRRSKPAQRPAAIAIPATP